jgi:hypothetical protein
MYRGRYHFHLASQSSYPIGERANPDVAPAPLPNILRYGGYKGEAAIHADLVGNSFVRVQYRGQCSLSVFVPSSPLSVI